MFWPVHCHPDFGYLAPTSRFWKLVRVGAIAGTLGLFAGSVGMIAFSQRPDIERLREEISPRSAPFASSDRKSAPPDTSCPSLGRPDDNCLLQERFPEAKRPVVGSLPRSRGLQDSSPPAAMPPSAVPPALPPAAAQPTRPAGAEGIADPPTAAVDSAPSVAVPQKARRRSYGRRARDSLRSDSQLHIDRVERRSVLGEAGRNGYDREPGRNDPARQSNYPAAQAPQERRGFYWCQQAQGVSC
jgi:hypothetical protein